MAVMSDQTLRTLIVDDEPLARRGLRLRLAGETDIDIIGECTNGEEAVRVIAAEKPDLVFLDVQMPGLDGFGVLRRLPLSNLPMVVFVTAFDHYAIGAFEASAVDYLLKPVEEARLSQALFRVREQAQARAASEQRDQLLELLGSVTGRPELSLEDALAAGAALPDSRRPVRLAIRDGGKTVLVEETDIDWIDAAGDYMCIHAKRVTRTSCAAPCASWKPSLMPTVSRASTVPPSSTSPACASCARTSMANTS